MDFSNIYRNPNREEGIRPIRQRISIEVIRLLGGRKVTELSLEEALKIKELSALADWGQDGGEIIHGLDEHIDSLYEIEAAGEFVKALKLAYIRQSKLNRDIEELKSLLTESDQQVYREREAARSRMFGIDRGPDIKRLEEGMKVMLEDLNQKTEEKRILEQEISKLQLQIKKLKDEYLALHRPIGEYEYISNNSKIKAWGILKDSQIKEGLKTLNEPKVKGMLRNISSSVGGKVPKGLKPLKQSSPASMAARIALQEGQRATAMRWAEGIQGVKLPSWLMPSAPPQSPPLPASRPLRLPPPEPLATTAPPPLLSPTPVSAYHSIEHSLDARESRNAAEKIFSKKLTKNKPTYGIPNLGTGFGGGYRKTRRRRYSRKRKTSYKK